MLLLHGLGADHSMWKPQLQTYAEAGYQLLVPDLFGHGLSSKLPHLSLDGWHHQLNWLLDDHHVEQCNLIGVSMGGVIAQSYAVKYPQRVKKMVISDSFGELRTWQERLLGLSQVIGLRLFQLFGKRGLAKGLTSAYKAAYTHNARDYFAQMSLSLDLGQMILARKAINRINVLKDLNDITIPTLVLVGAAFGQTFIGINRKIAEALPNSEFVVLRQAMDPSNLVNPVAFDRQVLRFFKHMP